LSESVHHVTLSCWDGQCSLTTLTLNQCGLEAFYPKIERSRSSTGERGFSVIELQPGLILVEVRDEATMSYQFQYATRENPNLSDRLGLKQTRWFERLTGFSGGALKYSVVLGKVLTRDLVPLKGIFPRIKAACDILLDGVPE
jgi:hypothetical protein